MKHMIILLPIIYLLGNGYIFTRLWSILSHTPLWSKILCTTLFWFVALMLFVVIIMRDLAIPEWISKIMYLGGSSWLVVSLYMVIFLVITDIIKLFIPSFTYGFICSLGATLLLLAYGYINYRNLQITEIKISTQKPINVDSLKIVAVSDIHLGLGTGKRALQRYVDFINSQEPDIVLIAGDLIDNSIKPVINNHMDKELNAIKAPMGVFLVPGNHEYISNIKACEKFFDNTSITLLRDTIALLPCGVQIVGRDDRHNRHRKSLTQILKTCDNTKPIIMLDHQPYKIAQKDSLGVDLQISGHTHRGQVWPLSIMVDKMYEQSHGYRKWSHSHVYVSSGLSLWGPPFRIGTRSDMAVITLYSIK